MQRDPIVRCHFRCVPVPRCFRGVSPEYITCSEATRASGWRDSPLARGQALQQRRLGHAASTGSIWATILSEVAGKGRIASADTKAGCWPSRSRSVDRRGFPLCANTRLT